MPSQQPAAPSPPLKRGDYAPRKSTDLRSPCPAVNTLASHGYIPRDGRNVRASEIHAGLGGLGIASLLGSVLTYPIFIEDYGPQAPSRSWWNKISNPFSHMFRLFAMRTPGQTDADGIPCLNLDQLRKPECVEHDISLTRFDHAQGDNVTPQPALIKDMLASSHDGARLTVTDLANFRKSRIEQQRRDNPSAHYEAFQNQIACGEIALILKVLGNGHEVPVNYVRAFFQEERLPREEGWKPRSWWRIGLVELNSLGGKVKKLIGDFAGETVPVVAAVH